MDPLDGSTIFALYASPTPVCPVASIGPTDATYMYLNSNVYCLVQLVQFQDQADSGLTAGQSVTLSTDPLTCQNMDNITGGCGTVNAPAAEEPLDYLAADAQPALAALANPPALLVLVASSSGANPPAGSCSPSDTLGWIAASTVPITTCS